MASPPANIPYIHCLFSFTILSFPPLVHWSRALADAYLAIASSLPQSLRSTSKSCPSRRLSRHRLFSAAIFEKHIQGYLWVWISESSCYLCRSIISLGVRKVLLKLGSKGSALFIEGEKAIRQAAIPAAEVVDTTGAGDTFTAAFAVALVEGMSLKGCLEFAAAAASLCVEVKGAIASMPDRKAVLERLQSVNAKGHYANY